MIFPCAPALVQEAGDAFDALILRIWSKDFGVVKPLEVKVCKESDLLTLCVAEGILAAPQETRRRGGAAWVEGLEGWRHMLLSAEQFENHTVEVL